MFYNFVSIHHNIAAPFLLELMNILVEPAPVRDAAGSADPLGSLLTSQSLLCCVRSVCSASKHCEHSHVKPRYSVISVLEKPHAAPDNCVL